MGIEIFGHLTHRDESEAHLSKSSSVDLKYIQRQARDHENAGFDGVLVGMGGDGPDSLQLAAYAVAQTERLHFLVANRPGLFSPVWAARSYATLDRVSQGRVRYHVVSGRDSDGQSKYGDPLRKEDRYKRTREFIQVLKKTWTEREPFSFNGDFYNVDGFVASVFPLQAPRIPVYFAGNSESAFAVGASEADRYALYAQPLDSLKQDIARIRREAKAAGRSQPPDIIVFVRLILGATEDLAWRRAEELRHSTLQQTKAAVPRETRWVPAKDGREASAGDRKQVEINRRGERHDRALWTGLSGITERGRSTALVGTPDTIVSSLLDYVDAGVSTFILDGFDRVHDVPDYGRYVIPALREATRSPVLERGAA